MRSFLEFMSCCVTTPEVPTNEEVVMAATASSMEETRSLMPPKMAAALRKKKRVRVGTPGSMAQEWKPSLYAISEDSVTAEKKEKTPPEATTTAADRVAKRKSMTGSRSKVHVRSYSDEIRQNPLPVVIPTFSPTPFMF